MSDIWRGVRRAFSAASSRNGRPRLAALFALLFDVGGWFSVWLKPGVPAKGPPAPGGTMEV